MRHIRVITSDIMAILTIVFACWQVSPTSVGPTAAEGCPIALPFITFWPLVRLGDDVLYHVEGCIYQAAPVVVVLQGVVRCPELASPRYADPTLVHHRAQLPVRAARLLTVSWTGTPGHILLR